MFAFLQITLARKCLERWRSICFFWVFKRLHLSKTWPKSLERYIDFVIRKTDRQIVVKIVNLWWNNRKINYEQLLKHKFAHKFCHENRHIYHITISILMRVQKYNFLSIYIYIYLISPTITIFILQWLLCKY